MTDAVRVQVLMPRAEAERFDAYCREKGYKKSPLIARLVREHLDREWGRGIARSACAGLNGMTQS